MSCSSEKDWVLTLIANATEDRKLSQSFFLFSAAESSAHRAAVLPCKYNQETDASGHNLDITMRQYLKWPTLLSVVEVEYVYFFSDAFPRLTDLFKHVAKWRNYTALLSNCIQSPHMQNIFTKRQHHASVTAPSSLRQRPWRAVSCLGHWRQKWH